MNIYTIIRKLAKSTEAQNTFLASKDIYGIRLFKNSLNLSNLQQLYISYLYMYHNLHIDFETGNISKHIFDSYIYEDAYLLWKREKGKNKKLLKRDNVEREVKLVISNNIKFPEKEVK